MVRINTIFTYDIVPDSVILCHVLIIELHILVTLFNNEAYK